MRIPVRIRWAFKLEDFWIGFYWRSRWRCLDIWICFVPCFPIHVRILRKEKRV